MSLIGGTAFQKSDGTPNGVPNIVGHRGFRGRFPENTMLAIREGVKAGAKVIETDIQLSKDHVVVMCHDVDTGRCFNTKYTVEQTNYHGVLDQLYTKDKYQEKMPTLTEFARAFKEDPLFEHVTLMIDIKRSNGPEVIPHMIKALEEAAPLDYWVNRCILGVWRTEVLAATEKLCPVLKVCFIGWEQGLAYRFMESSQVAAISLNYASLTILGGPEVLDKARSKGLQIYAWTVNNPEPMKWSVAARLDGVITDYPDLLSRYYDSITESELYGIYFTSEPDRFYSWTGTFKLYSMYVGATWAIKLSNMIGVKSI